MPRFGTVLEISSRCDLRIKSHGYPMVTSRNMNLTFQRRRYLIILKSCRLGLLSFGLEH